MAYGWMLGLVVALAVGVGAGAWLWTVGRRRDEAAAGLAALAGMRWREFSHFVLDAMRHRGFEIDTDAESLERGQQSDFILQRPGGSKSLLSCKHGSNYRIDAPAVAELVSAMRFNDATGGVLVTTGHVEAGARAAAERARVEVLGGTVLWDELRGFLPDSLRESLQLQADAQARRRIVIAGLGALVVGVATAFLTGGSPEPAPEPPAPVVRTPPAPAGARAGNRPPPATAPRTAAPATPPGQAVEESTADSAARQDAERAEIARVVAALPGVETASWPTRSTLLVVLMPGAGDQVESICTVVEQYPDLRTSRLQLQPPEGSTAPVRFRQCAVY
ncbi:hypothetical protein GCM10028862_16550 [Luteimonas pelagia]